MSIALYGAEVSAVTMPRAVCLTCENTGQEIEYRLVWDRVRDGAAPLPCGRRVADEADGWVQAKLLGPLDINIQVVSGAKACEACRRRRDEAAQRAKAKASGPMRVPSTKLAQANDDRDD